MACRKLKTGNREIELVATGNEHLEISMNTGAETRISRSGIRWATMPATWNNDRKKTTAGLEKTTADLKQNCRWF